jgi:H+/gluconate symporter-like permease
MLEVIGVVVSIILLMMFAYYGFSILVISPLIAAFAVLVSNNAVLANYTQIFMEQLGNFAVSYFPLFLLSAIFGKSMDMSGCSKSIANYISEKFGDRNAILAIVLSCSVLTYGGISLFIVAFAVYPIAVELFKKSNTPKRLIPGAIALGSFTYTMVALPGTPAIQNAIPSQYFGTDTFAAPIMGIVASILMFSIGMWWLNHQQKLAHKKHEGYGHHVEQKISATKDETVPSFWISIIPIISVVIINYICVKFVFPNMDTSYLALKEYGATDIKSVAGNWGIIVAVFLSICFILGVHYERINLKQCLNSGAVDSLLPIFNTASVVGYGAVINNLKGFSIIREAILSYSTGNPIISSAFITGLLGGITGSASGGMSISLQILGAKYLEMANAADLSPEILHRLVSISSASLNAVPHNGAIVTLLAICSLTHRDSYRDIIMVAFLGPLVATLVAMILGYMNIC